MRIRYDDAVPFKTDVKRFRVPATVEAACPECGVVRSTDLEKSYLSYPHLNDSRPVYLCCHLHDDNDCENEWPVWLRFTLVIEADE